MANHPLILVSGCIIMAALAGGCTDTGGSMPEQIARTVTPAEASALIEGMEQHPGFVIIDVRRPDEFADGHVPDAVNIDSTTFSERIAGLDPDGSYVVYCERGGRSAGVCKMMQKAGFSEVYEIEGGFSAWKAAGLPVAGS